ncbi:MAG: uncharacterized protein JWO94_2949 [Verrucomicrobiaceae bacterium]|nr:uncharacterized protein [Verrucomicrobiaceae bacterium]
MSHLLDASVLIACGWETHTAHDAANRWLSKSASFSTSSIVQMAFVRVSMSQAYEASFGQALTVLQSLLDDSRHQFVADDIESRDLPAVQGNKEVTDAHLVILASRHHMKLATLDKPLSEKNWARGIAELIN